MHAANSTYNIFCDFQKGLKHVADAELRVAYNLQTKNALQLALHGKVLLHGDQISRHMVEV